MIRRVFTAALLAAAAFSASPALAASIYLDFEGIAPYPNNNNVSIGDYYNGGTSSIGTSGTNYGVQFTSEALLLCMNTAGTTCSNTSRGGQGIPTSQYGALFFPSGNPTMNVAAGFTNGFSFVYSDPFAAVTTVAVYGGLNGTGSLLASLDLSGTPKNGCDSAISGNAAYCPFLTGSVGFNGTAQSVKFLGENNRQVFDDFTFGSVTVGGGAGGVPEPSTWALMLLGVAAVGQGLRARNTKRSLLQAV